MNIITSLDIVDRPTDPYRIIPILEEFRKIWDREPNKTFSQIFSSIVKKEYEYDYTEEITDDEFVAAIQNYNV